MSAVVVEIGDVGLSEPNRVALAEYDHVIEEFAAAPANPPLSDRILPGTAIGRSARLGGHST